MRSSSFNESLKNSKYINIIMISFNIKVQYIKVLLNDHKDFSNKILIYGYSLCSLLNVASDDAADSSDIDDCNPPNIPSTTGLSGGSGDFLVRSSSKVA